MTASLSCGVILSVASVGVLSHGSDMPGPPMTTHGDSKLHAIQAGLANYTAKAICISCTEISIRQNTNRS